MIGGLLGIAMIISVFLFINSQKDTIMQSKKVSNTKMKGNKTMVKENSSADLTFLNDMIEHHIGAVAMAKEAQKKSTRIEIQTLANNIITAQEKEIDMMYGWKKNWFNDTQQVEESSGEHGTSMTKDLGEADDEFDLRFMNAMIEHHQKAIEMAQDILKTTQRQEIKTLAQNIVKDQTKEISQMNQWKRDWGYTNAMNNDEQGNVKTFTVTAKNYSFSLKEIKVKKGDRVKIILDNTEGFHDWVLDEFNANSGRVQAGQKVEVEFVADQVGTFEYYCSVGNHRAMGMKGNLIVE